MYQLLSRYLFQYKHLSIPGLGSFILMPKQATANLTSRSINAPGWDMLFMQSVSDAAILNSEDIHLQNNLYNWLASHLNLSKQEVILQFDEFADSVKHKLQNGEKVEWEGMGTLMREGDKVLLNPLPALSSPFDGVKAEKIIRENSNHDLLVGERETTSDVMRKELLEDNNSQRLSTIIVLVIAVIVIAVLAWYLLTNLPGSH